jgi:predicted DNA-binding protein (MmcQ/YjbR family)
VGQAGTFRVRSKIFMMFSEEERQAWVKSTHDEQRAARGAGRRHVLRSAVRRARAAWVGVVIHAVDPGEMEELVTEAWATDGAKRLLARVRRGGG